VNAEAGGKIVVGVDGSDSSLDALRWAARQAELTGAEIDVVVAWPSLFSTPREAMWAENFDPEADARRWSRASSKRSANEHPDLTVHTEVIEDTQRPPSSTASQGVELLVVGAGGTAPS